MNAAELSPEFRRLIDARLDAVERALLQTDLTRGERQNVVAEVETQIFELLARRGESPTLDDLQAVLCSLDQPEAFRNESTTDAAPTAAAPAAWKVQARAIAVQWIEVGGWVVGAVVVNGVVLAIAIASDGVVPWVVFLGGLAWANCRAIPRIKRWLTAERGHLFDDVRQRLGTWLMPRSEAAA